MGSDLQKYFSRMGARVKVLEQPPQPRSWRIPHGEDARITLDVGRDNRGEFFEIRKLVDIDQEIVVLNIEAQHRHLLLLSRQFGERGRVLAKQKFLCGHDERHWFVAAIPESEPVSSVAGAQLALKPEAVRERETALGLSPKQVFRRRNPAFVRQGEWFFVPAPDLQVNPLLIVRHEPLSRGNGSKAHWMAECYRAGGTTVYVSHRHPTGLTEEEYQKLPELSRKQESFRMMRRDAAVFVRGEVRHSDHATVLLPGWHRVLMNTENRAQAMRFVTFLD